MSVIIWQYSRERDYLTAELWAWLSDSTAVNVIIWQQSCERDYLTAELWTWLSDSRVVRVKFWQYLWAGWSDSRAMSGMIWQQSYERDDLTAGLWAGWSDSRAVARKKITVCMKRQLTWRQFAHFMQVIMRFCEVGDPISNVSTLKPTYLKTLLSYLLIPRGKLAASSWRWTLPPPSEPYLHPLYGFMSFTVDLNVLLIHILLIDVSGPEFPVSVLPFSWAPQPSRNVPLDAGFPCNKPAMLGEKIKKHPVGRL